MVIVQSDLQQYLAACCIACQEKSQEGPDGTIHRSGEANSLLEQHLTITKVVLLSGRMGCEVDVMVGCAHKLRDLKAVV